MGARSAQFYSSGPACSWSAQESDSTASLQHHSHALQNPAVQKTLKTSHTLPDKNDELGHICFPAPLQKAAQLPDQHF